MRPFLSSCSCCLLLVGCASRVQPSETPAAHAEPQAAAPLEVDAGGLSEADTAALARDKTLRPELSTGMSSPYVGVLDRKGLLLIIEQGLGRVLAKLKLSPVLTGDRFQGFRVSEIDSAWVGTGLVVGDVVMRVNGQPIDRPEQAMVAFESLRVASEVAVELVRAGEKLSLRYRVE